MSTVSRATRCLVRIALVASAIAVVLAFVWRRAPVGEGPSAWRGVQLSALFFLAHAFLAMRARAPRLARTCLAITPVGAVLGMGVAPHAGWLAVFALGMGLAILGRLWIAPGGDDTKRPRSLIRLAFDLSAVVLLLLPAIHALLIALPRQALFAPAGAATEFAARASVETNERSVQRAVRDLVEGGIGFSGALDQLEENPVLEVRGATPRDAAALRDIGTL